MSRILVVDDFPAVLELMARILREELGAEVVTASTVGEALARTGPFDLLLLDRRLPNGDGREIADHYRHIRAVFVSGHDDNSADLRKPFTRGDLVAAVRAQLAPRPGP